MAGYLFPAIVAVLVIIVGYIVKSTKILKILFSKPLKPKGAVEIDKKEHIYAHPDCADKLQDFESLGLTSLYDVVMTGMKYGGDRPLFSFRNSSEEKFKSYTYTYAHSYSHEIFENCFFLVKS